MNFAIRFFGICFVIVVLLVGSKYLADRSAWSDVQAALYRVDSGIQYESIIALRSHLADADALVRTFESSFRIYPVDRGARTRLAKLAISYLGLATDFQMGSASSDNTTSKPDDFLKLGQAPDVSTFVPRRYHYGYLTFDVNTAVAASLRLGEWTMKRAEGEALGAGEPLRLVGDFGPLNFAAESNACKLQEQKR